MSHPTYQSIYAEESETDYKVYVLDNSAVDKEIVTYYLHKSALAKVLAVFSSVPEITNTSREYLYVDTIISYARLVQTDQANSTVLRNALAREVVQTILIANFDGTSFPIQNNQITEETIEILAEIYAEPMHLKAN